MYTNDGRLLASLPPPTVVGQPGASRSLGLIEAGAYCLRSDGPCVVEVSGQPTVGGGILVLADTPVELELAKGELLAGGLGPMTVNLRVYRLVRR